MKTLRPAIFAMIIIMSMVLTGCGKNISSTNSLGSTQQSSAISEVNGSATLNEGVDSALRKYAGDYSSRDGEFLALVYRIFSSEETDLEATAYVLVKFGWYSWNGVAKLDSGAEDEVAIKFDKINNRYVFKQNDFRQKTPSPQWPQKVYDDLKNGNYSKEINAEYDKAVEDYTASKQQ